MTKKITSNNIIFRLMRELIQEHTSSWSKSIPELTKQQYSVLAATAEKPGIEQQELAKAALISKATLAELLLRMEQKNMLIRKMESNDRRRRYVFLTEMGQQILNETKLLANKVDKSFLKHLNKAQQHDLTFMLQQLLDKENNT